MTSAHFQSGSRAGSCSQLTQFDLAFVDLKMTPIDGMVILQAFREHAPQTTVAHYHHRTRLHRKRWKYHQKWCTRLSAKPFDYLELQILPKNTQFFTGYGGLVLREQARQMAEQGELITRNPKMRDLLELALRSSRKRIWAFLIEGESSAEKACWREWSIATAPAHTTAGNGKRCAAENLLESRLFGHVERRVYRRDKRSFGQIWTRQRRH